MDDISYQKMYGVYGLTHHILEISGDVTDAGRMDKREDGICATQLLICEALSFAILLLSSATAVFVFLDDYVAITTIRDKRKWLCIS